MTFIFVYLLIGALLTVAIQDTLHETYRQNGGQSSKGVVNLLSTVITPVLMIALIVMKLFKIK
ncbi:hypothetical protein AVU32_gp211 [Vibrio phage ValKK3]|uniref:Uncharacterized protein n=1 Tax=Vibrio phage ValKK3 TaxID=1610855 RepID=A0A0D4DBM9_9CAUD|nr:hypothetical protein AVU32_gp211 [Vibrio phage ValKK3]AJT61052.1 hypothetical protein [Vibrio phage ValKK3]